MKKDPPSIEPMPVPGPDYDPMDRVVQDLQNIQSFLLHLDEDPTDLYYLDTHLSQILKLRRTIAQQIEQLREEPYDYSLARIAALKKENEQLFLYLEGAVGSLRPLNPDEFKRFFLECGKIISRFDNHLTP